MRKDESEVIIVRDDWEKFNLALERLMTLHEQTLKRLNEVNRRNVALKTELREALGGSPSVRSAKHLGSTVNASPTILERLIGSPRPHGFLSNHRDATLSVTVGLAKCGRCGRQLTKPSRFCEHCRAPFGTLICGCGRDLGNNDTFCDWCGRRVWD